VKELGEIDMVPMALVAAIDTELLEPPDAGTDERLAGALRELLG
jgi:hypothetical protein